MPNSEEEVLDNSSNNDGVLRVAEQTARVYLKPRELQLVSSTPEGRSLSLNTLLLRKIRGSYEKRCTKDGYVISISDEDVRHSNGDAPFEHFNGCLLYTIAFKYTIANPPIRAVIPVVVTSFNKIGMSCQYFPYAEGGEEEDQEEAEEDQEEEEEEEEKEKEEDPPSSSDLVSSSCFARHRGKCSYIVVLVPKAMNYTEPSARALYSQCETRLTHDPNRRLRLNVMVIQKKFDINDKQITAVGRLCAN